MHIAVRGAKPVHIVSGMGGCFAVCDKSATRCGAVDLNDQRRDHQEIPALRGLVDKDARDCGAVRTGERDGCGD